MKCATRDCGNTSDQGSFVGEFCSPCNNFYLGKPSPFSQAHRNARRTDAQWSEFQRQTFEAVCDVKDDIQHIASVISNDFQLMFDDITAELHEEAITTVTQEFSCLTEKLSLLQRDILEILNHYKNLAKTTAIQPPPVGFEFFRLDERTNSFKKGVVVSIINRVVIENTPTTIGDPIIVIQYGEAGIETIELSKFVVNVKSKMYRQSPQ